MQRTEAGAVLLLPAPRFGARAAELGTSVIGTVRLCITAFVAVPLTACVRRTMGRAVFLDLSASSHLTGSVVGTKVEVRLAQQVSCHIAALDFALDMNYAERVFAFDYRTAPIGFALMFSAAISLVLARFPTPFSLAAMSRAVRVF